MAPRRAVPPPTTSLTRLCSKPWPSSRSTGAASEWHGALYQFLRNGELNANSWTSNRVSLPRNAFRRNEYGAAIGGPVRIPEVYNGVIAPSSSSTGKWFQVRHHTLFATAPDVTSTVLRDEAGPRRRKDDSWPARPKSRARGDSILLQIRRTHADIHSRPAHKSRPAKVSHPCWHGGSFNQLRQRQSRAGAL